MWPRPASPKVVATSGTGRPARPTEPYARILTRQAHSRQKLRDISQRVAWLRDTGFQKIDGVRDSTLRSWQRGDAKPGFEGMQAIVTVTGCDPGWLLTGQGEPFPTQVASPAAAEAVERAYAATVRSAAAMADAVSELDPQIGAESVRRVITQRDLWDAAESLRYAARLIEAKGGPEGPAATGSG